MGRIKARKAKRSYGKRVAGRVYVGRSEGRDGFQACVVVGKSNFRRRDQRGYEDVCAYASNPRKAIAAAMRKAATNVEKRGGAFNGLK